MNQQLPLNPDDYAHRAVSPLMELGAYEALWLEEGATFKKVADKFREHPGSVPSDFVPPSTAQDCARRFLEVMEEDRIPEFGVRIHGAGEYPEKLRDARHPVELLYFRGWWSLVETPCIAVVGTRKPTSEGRSRAFRLAGLLGKDGYTIVSGLAEGIDTVAHRTAIEGGYRTIAVVGTPINRYFPAANRELQDDIAANHLVISQVPLLRYLRAKNPTANSYFFPERNVTMSALTAATIIVEAGDTSGTLYQAKAAIDQGRKLFILDSCFNVGLEWPAKYEAQGAIRVRDYDDIRKHLPDPTCPPDLLG